MALSFVLLFLAALAHESGCVLLVRQEGDHLGHLASEPQLTNVWFEDRAMDWPKVTLPAGQARTMAVQVPINVTNGRGDSQLVTLDLQLDLENIFDDIIGSVQNGVQDAAQSIVNSISSALSPVIDPVVGAVTGIVDSVTNVVNTVHQAQQPLQDGGASREEVNTFLYWALMIGICLVLLGGVLDLTFYKAVSDSGRPRLWLVTLVLVSYGLLIPGLYEVLFSMVFAIHVLGLNIVVTKPDPSSAPGPVTESTLSVLKLLWRTGGHLAAVLIVIYAIVIPFLKLTLLILGEVWRFNPNPAYRRASRTCIRVVQAISKWACPDMMAYILLLYLLRDVTGGSGFLEARSHLDIGFSCFSLFCILSTFSALAIKLPNIDAEADEEKQVATPELVKPASREIRVFTVCLTAGLAVVFGICLGIGMGTPSMGLSLNVNLLVEPHGPLPSFVLPIIQTTGLMNGIGSEVTIVRCIQALWGWWQSAEANCIIGLIMVGGFAVALPILDMVVLAIGAVCFGLSQDDLAAKAKQAARVIHHIAMLDVFVVGVIIVNLAAVIYSAQGLVTSIGPGLFALGAAEVAHYITFYSLL
eukprot:CAMPEP_0178427480 /NCGR_PEP_ID=MMETSP0689_2-20121128/29770_1 /TAXON_ID=160604 /ORGANISM="Amphidinium massartii, Strain CS-259" /LENGTH=583 /DNA_ID=CAMNT_0020049195 /DNA_START=63 /DNA_END=1810 /DNA_ORIENTATION=+